MIRAFSVVVVAGSIDRYPRITAVIEGQAAGFTVGTAAFDGAFPATQPGLTGQLEHIQTLISQAITDLSDAN